MPKSTRTWIRRTWALAIVCSCATSAPREPDSPLQPTGALPSLVEVLKNPPPPFPPPDPVAPDDTALFQQAALADRLLKGEASAEEKAELKRACGKKNAKNPFCPIVRDLKRLSAFFDESEKPYQYREPAPRVPVVPIITEGRLTNLGQLQKADVESLLPGLKALDADSMALLKRTALSAVGCPPSLSIALAATLEDGMPSQVDPKEIAALYGQAAPCYSKRSPNREHFLTRAGLLYLFAGDFKAAEKVLAKVSPQDALIGRAPYWLYRARKAQGDSAGAESARKRLWSQHSLSFHALMAALESGQSPETVFLKPPTAAKKRSKRSGWANRWLEALEHLKHYGFLTSAERLTFWISARAKHLEPEVRLYLAEFGNPLYKVTRLTELFIRKRPLMSVASFKLAHPLAYWPLMERNGIDLDPLLLLAVGRKESKFDPKAISPANAQGLLQVHPNTAKRLTGGADVDLTNPYVNITLGAHYLSELMKRAQGRLPWALAAYNAGEDAARSWLARFPHPDPLLHIDLITFRETRNYVGFVLTNYYWYRRLYQPDKGHPLEGLIAPEVARK
jgi:soluble lytic murein transglycosylase-like protein